jgi:hypothetical protein
MIWLQKPNVKKSFWTNSSNVGQFFTVAWTWSWHLHFVFMVLEGNSWNGQGIPTDYWVLSTLQVSAEQFLCSLSYYHNKSCNTEWKWFSSFMKRKLERCEGTFRWPWHLK